MKPPTISVNLYDPLLRSDFGFYRRIIPDKYAHSIIAFGGYDTATITMTTTWTDVEDWLEEGLFRTVKVYAAALDQIWEGFVNEIRINLGPLSLTRGPFLDTSNRVYVVYSPSSEGAGGFVFGAQAITLAENNTDSQAKFGIMPHVLNAGTVSQDAAETLRDVHLGENAWPKSTQSWTSSSNRPVTITLKCKGFYHLLNYPYLSVFGGAISATQKIINILNYTPNASWLAFDTSGISTNLTEVPTEDIQFRTGLGTIKGVVAMGDSTNHYRWLFYVLNDLKAYYHLAPFGPLYQAYVQHGGLILESSSQAEIAPWRLRPGNWVKFNDFLVGRNIIEVNRDPRLMFIEKVTYRAPFGLQLAGGNTDEINQLLAQMGAGGMS